MMMYVGIDSDLVALSAVFDRIIKDFEEIEQYESCALILKCQKEISDYILGYDNILELTYVCAKLLGDVTYEDLTTVRLQNEEVETLWMYAVCLE